MYYRSFLSFYLLYFLQVSITSLTIFIHLEQDISLSMIGKYTVHDLTYEIIHILIRQELR